MAPSLADRMIKNIVRGRCAECLHITDPKTFDTVRGQLEFGNGHQVERAQLVSGALALRIETTDRLESIAKEIEPHRVDHARWKQVDDSAAHRVIAAFTHGRSADESIELE